MNVKELIPIILGVLKDPRVIITTVLMILVIAFANFIINYKKKPPKIREKKSAPAPAPAKEKAGEPKADISEKDV